MEQTFALSAGEGETGHVLTCQSRRTSPAVTVDYDD
jgi:ring-1,2-phenylacetyl-CoA epoxidase subunit PaaE